MNMKTIIAPGAALFLLTSHSYAQSIDFSWEGSIEIGVESTFHSDDPTTEITDIYPSVEFGFEAAFSERFSAFGVFTFESVLDAIDDRAFDDLGFYVNELGVRYDFGAAVVSAGKLSPAFGTAWDVTPGFFGTALAEDYELSEVIGLTVDVTVMDGAGVISLAAFYADDTSLSNSLGTKRGRNTTAAGGAGNTGKLDNIALQFSQEFGATAVTLGARHLSAGQGDVSDETGFVAGVSHAFDSGLDVNAELAQFDGYGGSADDATYVTVGAAYGIGDWTVSVAATQRDIDSSGKDRLISVGLDYAFENGVELSSGLAFLDEAGVKSRAVGLSVVIPIGG